MYVDGRKLGSSFLLVCVCERGGGVEVAADAIKQSVPPSGEALHCGGLYH